MKINVSDPNQTISEIRLLTESPEAVIVHIDLNLKRSEVVASSGFEIWMNKDTVLQFSEMPFKEEDCRNFAETSRYTCYIGFVLTKNLENTEVLYERTNLMS